MTATGKRVVTVRPYEPSDHAAVLDVFAEAIRQYPENRNGMQPHWQRMIDESIQSDLADIEGTYVAPGGQFWVASVDNTIAGIVALQAQAGNDSGELRRMAVHPSFHRCGVGRSLVMALEAWAKDHGFNRVWLGTGRPVVDAQKFYESLGYQIFETKMLPIGVEILLYEKHLE